VDPPTIPFSCHSRSFDLFNPTVLFQILITAFVIINNDNSNNPHSDLATMSSLRSHTTSVKILPPTTALADGPIKVLDLTASAHSVKDLYPEEPVLTSESNRGKHHHSRND
jgi:hypothetical protein